MSLLDHGPLRNTSSASLTTEPAVLSHRSDLGVLGTLVEKGQNCTGSLQVNMIVFLPVHRYIVDFK